MIDMARELVSIVKEKMIEYYAGDSRRVHHFLKVHSFAKLIAEIENMDPGEQEVLEIAALTHDIGIKNAELKYGYNNGRLQEQEGPPEARRLLRDAGADERAVERACYLVAHHHTYRNIDGLDYQILVEADFLVNLYEDDAGNRAIDKAYKRIFKTETGKKIFRLMFGYEEED